jgi:hypothetical protein
MLGALGDGADSGLQIEFAGLNIDFLSRMDRAKT